MSSNRAAACRCVLVAFMLLGNGSCKSVSQSTLKDDAAPASDPDVSRIYESVRSALAQSAANQESWMESSGDLSGDWLMQSPVGAWGYATDALPYGTSCKNSDPNCDPDFGILHCSADADCGDAGVCKQVMASVKKPGDQPVNMCVGLGDGIVDRIYQILIKAKSTVDITSLSPPDGRYMAAIKNALLYLDYSGAHPDVRMVFGGQRSTAPDTQTPTQFLKGIMSQLKAVKSDFSLTLSCAWLSHLTTWNHSKIIAVDSSEAIVGSMNFWQRVYLQPQPVFDMSWDVTGPAAAAATKFADTLWAKAKGLQGGFLGKGLSYIGILPDGAQYQFEHASADALNGQAGGSRIISTGRLGNMGENSSDTAIDALIRSAQTSVRISQQDFYNKAELGYVQPYGMDAIVDRINNGVDVYIIKSSVLSSGYGMYNPVDTFDYMGRYIEKKTGHAASLFRPRKKGTYYHSVCDHLHFVPLHYSPANPGNGNVKSHTKLVIADDKAMYLGSQNLYNANLDEYGLAVFDANAVQTLKDQYWDQAWNASQAFQVPCTPVN